MNRNTMDVVTRLRALRERVLQARGNLQTVGLVPTMGALHAGHISLVQRSKRECDFTVATIFVNPTQFAEGEDLEKYPRTAEQDRIELQAAGVDVVFIPDRPTMYPAGCSTAVQPPQVASMLEGELRPSHFQGVCTIVLKLLNLVQPDKLFLGQKDYQQFVVVRTMVNDLNVPVEVVSCPTVRDADGLALSSRNMYLDAPQRDIALSLSSVLQFVKQQIAAGQRDPYALMAEMRQRLIDAGVDSVDYATIADPETLRVPETIAGSVVALVAAYVGTTRLIDNCLID